MVTKLYLSSKFSNIGSVKSAFAQWERTSQELSALISRAGHSLLPPSGSQPPNYLECASYGST
jgi:hypothetical protein